MPSNEAKNKLDYKFLTQIGLIVVSAISFILTINYKIDLLRNDMRYISKLVEEHDETVDNLKIRVTILEAKDGSK